MISVKLSMAIVLSGALIGCAPITPNWRPFPSPSGGPPGPPPVNHNIPSVVRFDVGDFSIPEDTRTTLSWRTQYADDVSITGLGRVNPSGFAEVGAGRYVLTARNTASGRTVTAERNIVWEVLKPARADKNQRNPAAAPGGRVRPVQR